MKVNSGGMSHGGKGAVEEGSEKEEGGGGLGGGGNWGFACDEGSVGNGLADEWTVNPIGRGLEGHR